MPTSAYRPTLPSQHCLAEEFGDSLASEDLEAKISVMNLPVATESIFDMLHSAIAIDSKLKSYHIVDAIQQRNETNRVTLLLESINEDLHFSVSGKPADDPAHLAAANLSKSELPIVLGTAENHQMLKDALELLGYHACYKLCKHKNPAQVKQFLETYEESAKVYPEIKEDPDVQALMLSTIQTIDKVDALVNLDLRTKPRLQYTRPDLVRLSEGIAEIRENGLIPSRSLGD